MVNYVDVYTRYAIEIMYTIRGDILRDMLILTANYLSGNNFIFAFCAQKLIYEF